MELFERKLAWVSKGKKEIHRNDSEKVMNRALPCKDNKYVKRPNTRVPVVPWSRKPEYISINFNVHRTHLSFIGVFISGAN